MSQHCASDVYLARFQEASVCVTSQYNTKFVMNIINNYVVWLRFLFPHSNLYKH
jgi:hypothetical protein